MEAAIGVLYRGGVAHDSANNILAATPAAAPLRQEDPAESARGVADGAPGSGGGQPALNWSRACWPSIKPDQGDFARIDFTAACREAAIIRKPRSAARPVSRSISRIAASGSRGDATQIVRASSISASTPGTQWRVQQMVKLGIEHVD